MIFGFLFVTFDSVSDPIKIATLHSVDTQIQVVPVEHITEVFKSFSFSPHAKEEGEFGPLCEGDLVVRGKHWKWGNQDDGGTGKVTEVEEGDEWVGVRWENGCKNKYVCPTRSQI